MTKYPKLDASEVYSWMFYHIPGTMFKVIEYLIINLNSIVKLAHFW